VYGQVQQLGSGSNIPAFFAFLSNLRDVEAGKSGTEQVKLNVKAAVDEENAKLVNQTVENHRQSVAAGRPPASAPANAPSHFQIAGRNFVLCRSISNQCLSSTVRAGAWPASGARDRNFALEMILKVLCRGSDHVLVLVEGGPGDLARSSGCP
jgi:hypothetical protein